MKLSILICTINGRENQLSILLDCLNKQITDDVEIIIEKDNKVLTTGAKRNILLKKAIGDYVAFVDDDDLVATNYIHKILNAIKSKPDCCGIEGLITFRKKGITKKFIHSIKYNMWFEQDRIYYRCPNHISPIKRKIVLKAMFPEQTVGEDAEFSKRVFPLLKNEVYINEPIYYYLTS